jgi:tetratricopeptide (TPR) repeat protein
MKISQSMRSWLPFLLLFSSLLAAADARSAQEPRLIRDTDIAEGEEKTETPAVKEPNAKLAERDVTIGNFYMKKKNYDAAIQRYLEAIEYKKDSHQAYAGLISAYEKNGEIRNAINACKDFLEKYPDSPKASEFRNKLAKLEKQSG